MIVALARAFPSGRVVGIDIEPRSVEMASARIRATGLEGRAETDWQRQKTWTKAAHTTW